MTPAVVHDGGIHSLVTGCWKGYSSDSETTFSPESHERQETDDR